jgi:hypothetical protein
MKKPALCSVMHITVLTAVPAVPSRQRGAQMKIFIHRWLGSVGAVIGAVTGQIISKNTHAGYPAKLVLVAMLSGVLASIAARIGQRLEQRRSEASYSS